MTKKYVLAIDDEPANLMLIEDYLTDEDVELTCVESAKEGLHHLRSGASCHAILLDRMMPEMDGMQFMKTFKEDPSFASIPVIMQTAAASPEQIAQGIDAGVFYYLTKPYRQTTLVGVLSRALAEFDAAEEYRGRYEQLRDGLSTLQSARLRLRTLEDVDQIGSLLASVFPESAFSAVALGLREILLNAVEHGNLGISYQEKSDLLASGNWEAEVRRRLSLPEHCDRHADVLMEQTRETVTIEVIDYGTGFDWRRYMKMDPERAMDSHGRGIAMAAMLGFDELSYTEPGNHVSCVKRLPDAETSRELHPEPVGSESTQASMQENTA